MASVSNKCTVLQLTNCCSAQTTSTATAPQHQQTHATSQPKNNGVQGINNRPGDKPKGGQADARGACTLQVWNEKNEHQLLQLLETWYTADMSCRCNSIQCCCCSCFKTHTVNLASGHKTSPLLPLQALLPLLPLRNTTTAAAAGPSSALLLLRRAASCNQCPAHAQSANLLLLSTQLPAIAVATAAACCCWGTPAAVAAANAAYAYCIL